MNTNQANKFLKGNGIFIVFIVFLVILLLISFTFNMMKCDDIRGRITLGQLYNDFKGNDDPNSRMTAQVDISTDEGACSFDVFYEYDGYREVVSNYRAAPISESEKNEIISKIREEIPVLTRIGDRALGRSDIPIDIVKKHAVDKYDIREDELESLGEEEILERIFEKYQYDKDICKKYQYPFDDVGAQSKEFLNRLLDDDYLERHVK